MKGQINYRVESSFMNNYHAGTPFNQKGMVKTIADNKGNVLLVSIGSDGNIYCLSPQSGEINGWKSVVLTACLDKNLQAVSIATSQNSAGKPLLCAVFKNKKTNEFCVYFTHSLNAEITAKDWVFRGSHGTLSITNICCGYAKNDDVIIGITTQAETKTCFYLINPDLKNTAWLWKEVPVPVNALNVIDAKIGHNKKLEALDGVDALAYVLYQTAENETALIITSVPDFKMYNHVVGVKNNPTAFDIMTDQSGNSELVFADHNLFHLSTKGQLAKESSVVVEETTKIMDKNFSELVKCIELGKIENDNLEVWALTKAGDLYHTKSMQNAWTFPFQFQSNVAQIGVSRNNQSILSHIFSVDLSEQLSCYQQDVNTTRWKAHPILTPSLDISNEYASYTTNLLITDEQGKPIPNHSVTILSSESTQLTINNLTYYVDFGQHQAQVLTDAFGVILIENSVDSIVSPTLRVMIDGLNQSFDINPMHDVQSQLDGMSINDLKSAQMKTDEMGKTEPLFKNLSDDAAAHAEKSIAALTKVASDLPANNFTKKTNFKMHLQNVQKAQTNQRSSANQSSVPVGYQFGIDLTGNATKFSDDQQEIDQIHLAKFNQFMSLQSQASLSTVGSEIEQFFGDLWNAVKKGFIQVEHLVVTKLKEGYQLIISTADGVLKSIVKFAEQAWAVVSHFLTELGATIMQVLRWLGNLFEWGDIVRSHEVLKSMFNLGINKARDTLPNAAGYVSEAFNDVRKQLKTINSQAASFANIGLGSAASTHGKPSPISSPKSNWAISKMTSSNTLSHQPDNETTKANLDDQLKKSFNEIKAAMEAAGKQVKQSFESGNIGDMLASLVAIMEEAFLSATEVLALGLIKLADMILSVVSTILNARWNIPLLTPLYENVIAPGSELSLLDLVCLVIAIPSTAMYKVAVGSAPFNDQFVNLIKGCKSYDELMSSLLTPDHLVKSTAPMSPMVAMVEAAAPAKKPSDGLLNFNYFLGYASSVCVCVYGVVNGIAAGSYADRIPAVAKAAGKIKLVTGIIANLGGLISMGITLAYVTKNRARYNYEMFVTVYQCLFNVNDALACAIPTEEDDFVDMDVFWAMTESALGTLNAIFFIALAIAEGVQGDMNVNTGMKLGQNLSTSVSQIMAAPTAMDDEPKSKFVLAGIVLATGTIPGIINGIRTSIDVNAHVNHQNV